VRRPWLVYLALTPLAHPVLEMLLFGERALQQAHDVLDDDIPRLYSIAADWSRFGPVLWDKHLTSGNALFAQFALPPTAPDVLLSFVVPPFAAFFLTTALLVFLSGLSMHLFLRDAVRLRAVACFAGGVMLLFAFQNYIYGFAVASLPLLLWSIDRSTRPDAPRRWLGLSALIVLFLLASTQIQLVVLAAGVTFVWVVLVARAGDRLATLRKALGAWALGALLAAPIVLAQLLAVPGSQREIWPHAASVPLAAALRDVLHRYAAVGLGVPGAGQTGPVAIYGTYFAGAIGLLCLAIGLGSPRRNRAGRALFLLLPALVLADVVAQLVLPYQSSLGVLSSFQFVRFRHFVPFAVAANIAVGVAAIAHLRPSWPRGRWRPVTIGWTAVLVLLALGTIAIQVRAIGRGVAAWLRAGGVGAPWNQEGVAWLFALAAFALAGLAVALVLVLAIRWRGLARGTGGAGSHARLRRVAGLVALVLVVGIAGERALWARSERLFTHELGTWAGYVAPTPAEQYVAAQAGGGRVATVVDHANRSLSAGLDAVDGYEVIYPLRYHELFGVLIGPQLEGKPRVAAYYGNWGGRAYLFGTTIRKPIADLLGVRWLIVADSSRIDGSIRSMYAGQSMTPGPGFAEVYRDAEATVYENATPFPRAFLVHELVSSPDRKALVAALAGASAADLRARAYVAAGDAPGVTLPGSTASNEQPVDPRDAADAASIVLDTPDRVEVETKAARDAMLVLADTYAAGWQVDVDGTPATIFPVDDALRGVAIPAGDHHVTFMYRPTVLLVGSGLSLAALALLAAWMWRGRRQKANGL
jgi:hypothetical protein